jgi:hypothetical protein
MVRHLLFFSILRTRSAHKILVGRSVIVLLGVSSTACEDDISTLELEKLQAAGARRAGATGSADPGALTPDQVRRIAAELAALEVEAGLEPPRDPSAPGGDLKRDLEEFTTLEACVKAHALRDPVLGDAIDALGYDTLTRDACRTLQALKAKDTRACQPISASPLRQRCEAQVAIVAGEPSLCPAIAAANAGAGAAREPVCLARASRDERFCAGALPGERTTCAALVRGKSNECRGDAACVRQVERFRSLLEKPESRPPFATRVHVQFTTDRGKSETIDGAFDLDDVAAAGAVVRPLSDKVRVSIGTPKTMLWPSWESPTATPHLYLAVSLPTRMPTIPPRHDAGAGVALGPADLSFDLLVPKVGLLSGASASERRAVIQDVGGAAGSPIRFGVAIRVLEGARTYRVQIDVETFVRDGAELRAGAKKNP